MPQHNQLTGSDLHEPKGVASAAVDTVYIADGAGSGAWGKFDTYRTTTVAKTADTARSSVTATAADPDLTFSVAANSKYLIELVILGQTSATPDFKYALTVPAGATMKGTWHYEDDTTSIKGTGTGLPLTGNIQVTTSPTPFSVVSKIYLVTAGTAGTFSFDWAQNTSSGTATTVRAGSYIDYRKIA